MGTAQARVRAARQRCAVIGAGPAGLTAALELARAGVEPLVFEMDDQVGGISRTINYKGYRFDIGGHRFFTKVGRVHDWWMEILEHEFLLRPRLSRIFYNDKFFDYPLKPAHVLKTLGLVESALIGLSYVKAQLFPHPHEDNLEQWVSNRFGKRLYSIFFKTYTEKVWGMKCTEIGADWAAQRIKNLDLKKAVLSMLQPKSGAKREQITSLIEQFHYPKYGPGQMWERVTSILEAMGHPVQLGRRVVRVHHDGARATAITVGGRDGGEERIEVDHVISSMPVRELVNVMDPQPPPEILESANGLRYRDFLTVGLVVDRPALFPDNWIYIHSPKVKVGRIQNFGNWSPYMVPEPGRSCIGLEYFVQEGDAEWSAKDEDLIDLGKAEAAALGLIDPQTVVDGVVIRMPKAYPVYDRGYKDKLSIVRGYVDRIANLQLIGRNGQHRYNNQDHSMMTAFYAAENVLGESHDVWDVNVDGEYHEESQVQKPKRATGDRLVPERALRSPAAVLQKAFAKYDPVALGAAVGTLLGSAVFLATAALLLRGGDHVGPTLSRLGSYFLGYDATWLGAFVGFGWGAATGFVIGMATAFAINLTVSIHLARLLRRLGVAAAPDAPDA
jgi:protoporphyrinogen oxidase